MTPNRQCRLQQNLRLLIHNPPGALQTREPLHRRMQSALLRQLAQA
jgi:hypothetical protein